MFENGTRWSRAGQSFSGNFVVGLLEGQVAMERFLRSVSQAKAQRQRQRARYEGGGVPDYHVVVQIVVVLGSDLYNEGLVLLMLILLLLMVRQGGCGRCKGVRTLPSSSSGGGGGDGSRRGMSGKGGRRRGGMRLGRRRRRG